MSFNKIIIVGNLGRDPELRYTPQGDAVCNFSVAVNEKKRDKAGELQDITTWFRVTLWRRQAENAAKYLTKGSPIYIEGRLHVEEWTDRDGNNRHTLEVSASDMQFLGGRGGDSESAAEPAYSGGASAAPSAPSAPSTPAPAPAEGGGNDDIPF
jgi:single-strand DNA-binding protein